MSSQVPGGDQARFDGLEGALEGIQPKNMPQTRLHRPQFAPQNLLDNVEVDPDANGLIADTDIGRLAVGVIYNSTPGQEAKLEEARFFAPLKDGDLLAEIDPDLAESPPLTHEYPYAELPYGSHYGIVIVAPSDKSGIRFSEPEAYERTNMSGFLLRGMFPGENIDALSEYNVRALKSSRNILGILIRNNGNQPVNRTKNLSLPSRAGEMPKVSYVEDLVGPHFEESEEADGRAYTVVAHRKTEVSGTDDADIQPLLFLKHNLNQGPANNAGLTEVIIWAARQTRYENVDLERIVPPPPPEPENTSEYPFGGGLRDSFRAFDDGGVSRYKTMGTFGGISSGATAYGRPTRVSVAESINVDDGSLRVVAAFRFVMVGADVQMTSVETNENENA